MKNLHIPAHQKMRDHAEQIREQFIDNNSRNPEGTAWFWGVMLAVMVLAFFVVSHADDIDATKPIVSASNRA